MVSGEQGSKQASPAHPILECATTSSPLLTALITSFDQVYDLEEEATQKLIALHNRGVSTSPKDHKKGHDKMLEVEVSQPTIPCSFHASFIYAKCTRIERRQLWDVLRTSASNIGRSPWFIGGDFNCFLHHSERVGSDTNRSLDMIEFGQMASDCRLIDAGYEGDCMHTWVRNNLKERLERIFLNNRWSDFFPKSTVHHPARIKSDHAPLLFKAYISVSKPPSSFRYFKMWARHHSFLNEVSEVWNAPTGFSGLTNLHHKMIRVKQRLKWWNINVFGNIFVKLKLAEQHDVENEQRYDSNPSPSNLGLVLNKFVI
ncbi:hypothetical protein DH2020_004128 [Rehmannia glutinosa]|uniref:Endonuclease/exonuclease/phosphatase domain-containing protein n=1 Tax=Rehmannia glutinosa TaxID=99300 RepID=A0ABR0XNN9_REHGL